MLDDEFDYILSVSIINSNVKFSLKKVYYKVEGKGGLKFVGINLSDKIIF